MHRGCEYLNYFNAEPKKLDKYMNMFSCFGDANVSMKHVRDKFEKYRLDDKEVALFLATLTFTTGFCFIYFDIR